MSEVSLSFSLSPSLSLSLSLSLCLWRCRWPNGSGFSVHMYSFHPTLILWPALKYILWPTTVSLSPDCLTAASSDSLPSWHSVCTSKATHTDHINTPITCPLILSRTLLFKSHDSCVHTYMVLIYQHDMDFYIFHRAC